jgi:hypothetical protein
MATCPAWQERSITTTGSPSHAHCHRSSATPGSKLIIFCPGRHPRCGAAIASGVLDGRTLIWKGCILDGWLGWLYVLQRVLAESMIAIEIIDRRVQERAKGREFGTRYWRRGRQR